MDHVHETGPVIDISGTQTVSIFTDIVRNAKTLALQRQQVRECTSFDRELSMLFNCVDAMSSKHVGRIIKRVRCKSNRLGDIQG